MNSSDAARLLDTPPSTMDPPTQKMFAKWIVRSIAEAEDINPKDRDFIKSLHNQLDSGDVTDGQLPYLLGDDTGDTPRSFPALRKRYDEELRAIAALGDDGYEDDFVGPTEAEILEAWLSQQWEAAGSNMDAFLKIDGVEQKRKRYLELTATSSSTKEVADDSVFAQAGAAPF